MKKKTDEDKCRKYIFICIYTFLFESAITNWKLSVHFLKWKYKREFRKFLQNVYWTKLIAIRRRKETGEKNSESLMNKKKSSNTTLKEEQTHEYEKKNIYI